MTHRVVYYGGEGAPLPNYGVVVIPQIIGPSPLVNKVPILRDLSHPLILTFEFLPPLKVHAQRRKFEKKGKNRSKLR